MNILKRLFGQRPVKNAASSFPAAEVSRLTNGWNATSYNADSEIRYNLKTVRARSRNVFYTNDYARRFIKMCSTNVVGPQGVTLRNKAADLRFDKVSGKFKQKLDTYANRVIEESFYQWSRKGICTVDGMLSLKDAQRMIIETIARDGEVLIRKIKGADNPWKFSIQILEADHLYEYRNQMEATGNKTTMSVEKDAYGKPVAYWLLKTHPGELLYPKPFDYVRIEAKDIIHPFIMERPTQSRGVPWMYTALTRLNNLGAYEEAAIMAARIGASNMGIFTSPDGEVNFGAKNESGEYTDGKDRAGNTVLEVEPGMFITAPEGTDFKEFNPKYPTGDFGPFVKATLRGVAAGLNVAYNNLASDLESVNYSSLRSGSIDERDCWKVIQDWFSENVMDPIFADWLDMALLTGQVNLPYAKFDKFNAPLWRARGFDWVDPEKDLKAAISAVEVGVRTRSDVCAERGLDFEEVLAELAYEEELIDKYDVDIALFNAGKQPVENADAAAAPGTPDPNKQDPNKKKDPNEPDPQEEQNRMMMSGLLEMQKGMMAMMTAMASRETTVENHITLPEQPAPQVTVNTPETVVENNITMPEQPAPVVNVAPPAVTVESPVVNVAAPAVTVENKIPRASVKKRKMTMLGPDGKVLRTVMEE